MKAKLHTQMLVALLAGAGAGAAANAWWSGSAGLGWVVTNVSEPVGKVFLRLLFMLVVPLLFAALVEGVAGLEVKRLGKIAAKTFAYTVAASAVAVVLGVTLVNVVQPGRRTAATAAPAAAAAAAAGTAMAPGTAAAPGAAAPKPAGALGEGVGIGLIVAMVPDNPIKAMAQGDMLAVMVFALIFGLGLRMTPTPAAARLREAIQGLYDVTTTLIGAVIKLAPIGVAALLFTLTARMGLGILRQLGAYVAVVLVGLAVHQFGVYSLSVRLLGGMSPLRFFRGVRVAMLTAFATASSNATLPTALEVAEKELKLPAHVSRFVLTVGSTMNQNGTALFEGVTVLFLAQFYGVHLGVGQQALVVFICVLGGIGTAGVPAGSLPVVAMILGMVGIPAEGIGMILGVDRFLDMCRTTLNVTGDLAAAVVVSRGEPHAPANQEET
jgi:DAACS family dicarboxylate/amino acid:cation (Na+ or H+) symporter